MNTYLISISIGPVQDFIAQARRSRDLWFGSHLLSEIARAAARGIDQANGELIFPAVDRGDAELLPCDAMRRTDGNLPLAVANKLLATAEGDEQAIACVHAARAEAKLRWSELAEQARGQADGLIDWPRVEPVWREQIDSLLEFYAAIAPVAEGSFAQVRETLERTLAARKNLREFRQYQHHRPGAPKSSFDGGRVSVLRPADKSKQTRRKYRIPQAENLDAVGVVKRAGGQPEQFVPISNIALAGWLTSARAIAETKSLIQDLERTMQHGVFRELFGRVDREDLPAGRAFHTDAQVFLDGRLEALLIESGETETRGALESDQDYRDLRDRVQSLRKCVGQAPSPYVAALVADGDRMGAALSHLTDAAALRQFSKYLSQFAEAARTIVEQECLGSLLYAGGDDVVAFLPLETAVACAAKLRSSFLDLMAPGNALPADWQDASALPTLSVGVGVGHVLDGMGNLLELGRSAERLAKGSSLPTRDQRDALAMVLAKRSGGRVSWRSRWHAPAGKTADEVVSAAMGRVGACETTSLLPATKLAQVRRQMITYPNRVDASESARWAELVRHDVFRTLKRSGRGLQEFSAMPTQEVDSFGLDLSAGDYSRVCEELDAWVHLHLIAKELRRASVPTLGSNEDVAA